jgi:type VI secretion system protein ImpJ
MSSNKRVIWSEGLFLKPQHFQQQDRHFERYTELRAGYLRPNAWGFTHVEIEIDHLTTGKLALRRARGIFPDGTPFSMPDDDPLPPAIELAANVRDKTAFLALPARKAGAPDHANVHTGTLSRFTLTEIEAPDTSTGDANPALLEVGDLSTCILLEGESTAEFSCIPLARILECRADRKITLDEGFIPTVLRLEPAAVLTRFVDELRGLVHQCGEELALRAVGSSRGGAAEIADYLILQLCNRYEPILTHWCVSLELHPEDLFTLAVSIAGEMATFSAEKTRRPPVFPNYEHARLRASFDPVIAALRTLFNMLPRRVAEPISLTARAELGTWHGVIADKTLIDTASFVLGVRADIPGEQLRRQFPAQSKVAGVEQIRRYVIEQVPGVPMSVLPQVPRQIPFHTGYVYFELDTHSPVWKQLRTSGGIAIHVGGQFPGIAMELWAIRG